MVILNERADGMHIIFLIFKINTIIEKTLQNYKYYNVNIFHSA